jgi:hypothetical protein
VPSRSTRSLKRSCLSRMSAKFSLNSRKTSSSDSAIPESGALPPSTPRQFAHQARSPREDLGRPKREAILRGSEGQARLRRGVRPTGHPSQSGPGEAINTESEAATAHARISLGAQSQIPKGVSGAKTAISSEPPSSRLNTRTDPCGLCRRGRGISRREESIAALQGKEARAEAAYARSLPERRRILRSPVAVQGQYRHCGNRLHSMRPPSLPSIEGGRRGSSGGVYRQSEEPGAKSPRGRRPSRRRRGGGDVHEFVAAAEARVERSGLPCYRTEGLTGTR